MTDEERNTNQCCAVFGVKHGGPVIGLGILLILFGLVPFVISQIPVPFSIILLFIGFGVFLIWVGLTE